MLALDESDALARLWQGMCERNSRLSGTDDHDVVVIHWIDAKRFRALGRKCGPILLELATALAKPPGRGFGWISNRKNYFVLFDLFALCSFATWTLRFDIFVAFAPFRFACRTVRDDVRTFFPSVLVIVLEIVLFAP